MERDAFVAQKQFSLSSRRMQRADDRKSGKNRVRRETRTRRNVQKIGRHTVTEEAKSDWRESIIL